MQYVNQLLLHCCLPVQLLPSRMTKYSATAIDHIYYFEGNNFKKHFELVSGNIFCDLSDHLPNFVLLNCTQKINRFEQRPLIRLLSHNNKHKFSEMLANLDWHKLIYNKTDVNECYNTLVAEIKKLYELNFPLVRQSRRASRDKKWMTPSLKLCSKRKYKLYKKWLVTKNDQDEQKYLSYKRIFKKVAKLAEKKYYNEQFDSKKKSMKQLWTNLNMLCNNKNKTQ